MTACSRREPGRQTVNIKTYGRHESVLDISAYPCDCYLVLTDPPGRREPCRGSSTRSSCSAREQLLSCWPAWREDNPDGYFLNTECAAQLIRRQQPRKIRRYGRKSSLSLSLFGRHITGHSVNLGNWIGSIWLGMTDAILRRRLRGPQIIRRQLDRRRASARLD